MNCEAQDYGLLTPSTLCEEELILNFMLQPMACNLLVSLSMLSFFEFGDARRDVCDVRDMVILLYLNYVHLYIYIYKLFLFSFLLLIIYLFFSFYLLPFFSFYFFIFFIQLVYPTDFQIKKLKLILRIIFVNKIIFRNLNITLYTYYI